MTAFGMILLFAFFTVHVLLDMTFFSLKKYCLKKYLYIIIVWYVWYVGLMQCQNSHTSHISLAVKYLIQVVSFSVR